MPIYTYEATNPHKACKHCREPFEVKQKMSDKRLKACPKCGGPVQRIITPVSVNTRYASIAKPPSDKELRRHGFHKLVNEGDGKFRKVT